MTAPIEVRDARGEVWQIRRVNPSYVEPATVATDRRVMCQVFRWGTPARLHGRVRINGVSHSNLDHEWFDESIVRTIRYDPMPPLNLMHYGRRLGEVTEWRNLPAFGLDAVAEVDDTVVGDGLLDLIDRHGELPLSPAFRDRPGGAEIHGRGVRWTRVQIIELAVVHDAALPWARIRRYGR